jgi:hypothetical protein
MQKIGFLYIWVSWDDLGTHLGPLVIPIWGLKHDIEDQIAAALLVFQNYRMCLVVEILTCKITARTRIHLTTQLLLHLIFYDAPQS